MAVWTVPAILLVFWGAPHHVSFYTYRAHGIHTDTLLHVCERVVYDGIDYTN